MTVFKCKMCGGNLDVVDGAKIVECEYCCTRQTVPDGDSEKKVNLYNRANRLRMVGEFDKANDIYENIIAEFPGEAEAYWGLCLCNYGIEYVDDPATARKIPTCHRASFKSLEEDDVFKLVMKYADIPSQNIYLDQVREIDSIRRDVLAVSKNEKPYDVFICYKETDENGSRTVDSVIAYDIYDALCAKGLKVFFARVTLEDKLDRQYEPYIFAALNTAKVMLCIGTKYDYFNAVWVKNEWSRFMKLMSKDKSKVLIP
ncbi:MAG: toll/interleukin-1 receptor domain-containing protein, partial [Clostridia bacterium]|nr:toll/interleukin-1 receptor domain-containing protein [Clostridia bacterium]